MPKNKHILYLSGLISEEHLTESSDFEHSLALDQKMQDDFEKLAGSFEECLRSCMALEKQARDNYAFHEKTGMGRTDSQGLGDSDYFEDVIENISNLTRSIQGANQFDRLEESINVLIKRLEDDPA